MAQEIPQVPTQPRERLGSRDARRLRDQGRLPVVIYGHQKTPVHVSLDRRLFTDLLFDNHHLIQARIDSTKESCLIKEVQWDYLGDSIVHVDLTRVDLTEEVDVEIGLVLTGEPEALQEAGAVLDHPVGALNIRCRADAIPEQIEVEIGHLGVGDSLSVGEVALPAGVTATDDPETTICTIHIMQEEPELEEPEAVEGEPEVIGEGEGEPAESESSPST